jgi:pheromone shutdown protein TraB
VGTAHVSKKSAEAVYRTIRAVEPDAVVVELCQ